MDLFGKKTQQELEQLQKKTRDLEVLYRAIVANHSKVCAELLESTALAAAINAAKKSKVVHQNEKDNHDRKADEYAWKSKEIASKEAELLAAHNEKKDSHTKELRELVEKDRAIKAALSDSQKRAKALEKEIQSGESKRDSVAAEIEKLKTGRSNAEIAFSKAQEKQSELTGAVDRLTRQQETLSKSNLYLNQVVSRLNRYGDENTIFASLEHDLHRFLTHDRTSGAMQVTLKARPLLLVVDLGYDSLNFAAVRAGLVSGGSEISLCVESRKIELGMGCSRFEALLAGWVWKRFSAIHPRLKKSVKEQNGAELSLPVARRLLALLCQGAPQGEVEETIVIDSEPFSAFIPLQREELVSVFLPLLGPDGELTGAIRRFLAEFKLAVNAIDRIVCLGWYGRLTLLRESLGEVFKKSVLVAEQLPTVGLVNLDSTIVAQTTDNECLKANVIIVNAESREEKEERERKERERKKNEEQECRERKFRVNQEKERKERELLEKERERIEKERIKNITSLQCPVTEMKFVFVKGGTYLMGDTFGDGSDDEKPVHKVTVSDFHIGMYQVTQGEWQKVMGSNPSWFKKGDRYPVENVSWFNVQEYIEKLNQLSGWAYRLPTEVEWEYAARSGGKNEKYSGGNNVNAVAWYEDNSNLSTHPVGLKQPNELGIYDMSGNVCEMCSGWKGPYPEEHHQDPQGPSTGTYRIDRGGFFCAGSKGVRASERGGFMPVPKGSNFHGFRLVSPVR